MLYPVLMNVPVSVKVGRRIARQDHEDRAEIRLER